MKKTQAAPSPLASLEEIELEVEAEGREWMRQRLQERLQQLADAHGEVFPPQPPAAAKPAAPHQTTARTPRLH